MISPSQRNYRRKRNYAYGSSNSIGMFLDTAQFHKLSPAEAMSLLVVFWNRLDHMTKGRDWDRPFNTRAMAYALDKLGIEDYNAAHARIAERFHAPKEM
jgi:hypothetical protein